MKIKHGHMIGHKPSPTYISWCAMIGRCTRSKNASYKRYGGRGIAVCQRWRVSFVWFLEDMGIKPPGMQLGRKDNDGNYEPGNCEWVTSIEQAGNKGNTKYVIFQGQRMSRGQAAREMGCLPASIGNAMTRFAVPKGVVPFVVLERPINSRKRLMVYFGEQGGLFG